MPYADPEQQRAYQREWIARRRQEWIEANGPCARCGSDQDLQVDHIDRAQKVDHKVWSWSQARRDEELAKCQVLCWPCHKEKSIPESARGETHGRSVLTASQVADVRLRVSAGETMAEVGRSFGVSRKHVWDLVHRRTRYHE